MSYHTVHKTCRTEGPCAQCVCDCGFYDNPSENDTTPPMTAKHLLSEIVAGLEDARKMFNEWRALFGMDGPVKVGMVSQPVERLANGAAYVEQLEKENRVLHELRRDLLTLQKRIIGETGLSAIETIDRALKVFEAAHLYEIFDEDRAALEAQPHSETRQEQR